MLINQADAYALQQANPTPFQLSIEAEQHVLGGLMLDPGSLPKVANIIDADDFYQEDHRFIYMAITDLLTSCKPFDFFAISEYLKSKNQLDQTGGIKYIGHLKKNVPSASNITAYAIVVKEKANLRKFAKMGQDIINASQQPNSTTDIILQQTHELLGEITPLVKDDPSRFHFTKVSDITHAPIDAMIQDFIERETIGTIFGDPGSGKSLIVLDMGLHIAANQPWCGKKVKTFPVVYVCGEGHIGVKRRIKAWESYHNIALDDLPFFISNKSAALCDANNAALVAREIESLNEPPGLIIIDTLAANLGAGNENDGKDMGQFITNVQQKLCNQFKASVIIIHHSGHADKSRSRGWSGLKGAVDFEFVVKKKDDQIVLSSCKSKDIAPPESLAFTIKQIELPFIDEYQNPIHSIVSIPVEYTTPIPKHKTNGKHVINLEQAILEIASQQHLNLSTNDLPIPEYILVTFSDARNRFYESLGASKQGTKRQAFTRAKDEVGYNTSGNCYQVPLKSVT